MERDGEIIANSLDANGIEDLSCYYLETNEWKTEAILYEKHPLIKEACRGDNLRVIKTTSGNDKGKSTYNFFVIVSNKFSILGGFPGNCWFSFLPLFKKNLSNL